MVVRDPRSGSGSGRCESPLGAGRASSAACPAPVSHAPPPSRAPRILAMISPSSVGRDRAPTSAAQGSPAALYSCVGTKLPARNQARRDSRFASSNYRRSMNARNGPRRSPIRSPTRPPTQPPTLPPNGPPKRAGTSEIPTGVVVRTHVARFSAEPQSQDPTPLRGWGPAAARSDLGRLGSLLTTTPVGEPEDPPVRSWRRLNAGSRAAPPSLSPAALPGRSPRPLTPAAHSGARTGPRFDTPSGPSI